MVLIEESWDVGETWEKKKKEKSEVVASEMIEMLIVVIT